MIFVSWSISIHTTQKLSEVMDVQLTGAICSFDEGVDPIDASLERRLSILVARSYDYPHATSPMGICIIRQSFGIRILYWGEERITLKNWLSTKICDVTDFWLCQVCELVSILVYQDWGNFRRYEQFVLGSCTGSRSEWVLVCNDWWAECRPKDEEPLWMLELKTKILCVERGSEFLAMDWDQRIKIFGGGWMKLRERRGLRGWMDCILTFAPTSSKLGQ